jgi:hypothetical protein
MHLGIEKFLPCLEGAVLADPLQVEVHDWTLELILNQPGRWSRQKCCISDPQTTEIKYRSLIDFPRLATHCHPYTLMSTLCSHSFINIQEASIPGFFLVSVLHCPVWVFEDPLDHFVQCRMEPLWDLPPAPFSTHDRLAEGHG